MIAIFIWVLWGIINLLRQMQTQLQIAYIPKIAKRQNSHRGTEKITLGFAPRKKVTN
jgi:hypothetical protein